LTELGGCVWGLKIGKHHKHERISTREGGRKRHTHKRSAGRDQKPIERDNHKSLNKEAKACEPNYPNTLLVRSLAVVLFCVGEKT